MPTLRLATIFFLSIFTFLCVGYANSQSGGTEQVFESAGSWGLLVGKCQLKVRTVGSQVFFMPSSASGTSFLGAIPDATEIDVPIDLSQAHNIPGGVVRESLHLRFSSQAGSIQPMEYDLTRAYFHDGDEVQRIETKCLELKVRAI